MARTTYLKLEPEVLSEHQEQVDLMKLVRQHESRYPELELLYAIPNGGWRNVKTAAKLKAEGVRPGVPDLHLPVARGTWIGLWIELKRTKGGAVRATQQEWHDSLMMEGHLVRVCKGADEAWKTLLWYLALEPTEVSVAAGVSL